MTEAPDPRAEAFEALLPLAQSTHDALLRVDEAVALERRRLGALRRGWLVGQRAQSSGFSRFVYGVGAVQPAWAPINGVRYHSTPEQESQNLYLWTLADRWPLRLKSEPVEGTVDPGAMPLVHLPTIGDDPTIFLTWDIADDGTIERARFATVTEPRWTIPLSQLVAHVRAASVVDATRPRPVVGSAREPGAAATEHRP